MKKQINVEIFSFFIPILYVFFIGFFGKNSYFFVCITASIIISSLLFSKLRLELFNIYFDRRIILYSVATIICFSLCGLCLPQEPVKIKFISIVSIVFAAPICEEFVYRYLAFFRTKRFFSTAFLIVICSILFAIGHNGLIQCLLAFLFGVFQCLLLEYSKSILYPIVTHCVVNSLSFINYKLPFWCLYIFVLITLTVMTFIIIIMVFGKQHN